MHTRLPKKAWVLSILLVVLSYSMCSADEILFKDQKARQIGTVLEDNEQGVTILFPKESIKSITKSKEGISGSSSRRVIVEDSNDYVTLKIPRQRIQGALPETRVVAGSTKQESEPANDSQLKEKVERLEKRLESIEKAGVSQPSTSPNKGMSHEALLQDEMGGVEGIILWKGKPLNAAKVKIVMDRYTGFSVAALKKMFGAGNEKSSEQDSIVLETETDSQGHYSFPQAPPGYYNLFWLPDQQTGWVCRLREGADFEVVPGKLAVVNIPEKKKQK